MNTNQMIDILTRSGMDVPPKAMTQFRIYEQMLISWNQRMNLIARGDEAKIVSRHFLESIGWLKIHSFSADERIVDIGTGAGFPGLPMAIIRPDLKISLVDSNRKKILFLKNVIQELECSSIRIVLSRAEELDDSFGVADVVVSRAVSSVTHLMEWTSLLLKRPEGTLMTLKGNEVDEDIDHLKTMKEKGMIVDWEIQPFEPFPGVQLSRKSQMIRIKT